MSNLAKVAGAALSVLAVTTVLAQAGGPSLNGNAVKVNLSKVVGCTVAGTPSEFPDDIWIMNKGIGTIAAGTKVKWSVPSANRGGNYTIGIALAPGQGVKLSGVLAGGVEAGRPCSAKTI